MHVAILALLCLSVYAAPLVKDAVEEAPVAADRSKRSQETIMFGNHQNAPRVKKGDPFLLGSREAPNVAVQDNTGDVKAFTAEDLPAASDDAKEEASHVEDVTKDDAPEPADSGDEGEVISSESQEPEEILVRPDDSESSEQSEQGGSDEEEIVPVSEPKDDVDDKFGDGEMNWDYIQRMYENPQSAGQYYYPEYFNEYRKKRSIDTNAMKEGNEVKRSHRTKRDISISLPEFLELESYLNNEYDDPIRSSPYDIVPDVYEDVRPEYYSGYRGIPDIYEPDDDDYDELMEELRFYEDGRGALDQNTDWDRDNYYDDGNEWDSDDFDNFELDNYLENKPQQKYPMIYKRQSLDFVPGFKRKRFSYPYAEEPQGHWGAFIRNAAQKRAYNDAYDRVHELAQLLAKKEAYDEYLEELEGYKKK